MTKQFLLMLIASIFLSGCVSTDNAKKKLPGSELTHNASYYYTPQTKRVVSKCFSPKLLNILGHIRKETGVKPILTSGLRTGGRKGSMHRPCKAADIRVPGVSDARIIQAAKTAPGIGGIGRYCNGIIHVDTGLPRNWVHC